MINLRSFVRYDMWNISCYYNIVCTVINMRQSLLYWQLLYIAVRKTFQSFRQPPMRQMRICFTDVFFVFLFFFCFLFFPSATKYDTTILGNGWTDFHETFTKWQRGKWSFHRRTQMGARPQINFLGLKTTQCTLGADAWRMTQNVGASVLYGGCIKKAWTSECFLGRPER